MHLLSLCALGLACLANAAALVPGKAFDRFITIWLENRDFSDISKDSHIADLKKEGILLTRYYANTHPSQPNYVASVGGDYFGLDHGDFMRVPKNVSTIVDLLDSKGISWAGYFENYPGPGYMGMGSDGATHSGQWDYVRKHNPFVSYDSINMNGSRLLNLQSFADFKLDFAAGKVPQFVFMTPNMVNDGHNTSIEFATSWAHHFIEPMLEDKAFDDGRTLIMLTYDESETYEKPNHIVTLLLGSAIASELKGTTDDTVYTHYSILSSVEHNWELPNLGRYDVGANVFKFAADISGYSLNRDPDNIASVNNSGAYPGALNSDPRKFMPIPRPNLDLVGAGGMSVLPKIKMAWMSALDRPTPYDGSGNFVDGGEHLPVYIPEPPNSI